MLGSIVSGIGSVLGGLFGSSSESKQMDKQIAAQREFAQQGVRWRVEDAKAAGVHPLYALGAQTHSFAPIGLGSNSLGAGLAQAGQDIGRGIQAKGTAVERAFSAKQMELTLQRGELENAVLASQLAKMNSPAARQPAMPMTSGNRWLMDGQGDSVTMPIPERFGGPNAGPLVKDNVQERVVSDPAATYQEPGAISDIGWVKTSNGGYVPVPSEDIKNRIEDQIVPEMEWALRNVAPRWIGGNFPPPFPAPEGKKWELRYGEYRLVPYSDRYEEDKRRWID